MESRVLFYSLPGETVEIFLFAGGFHQMICPERADSLEGLLTDSNFQYLFSGTQYELTSAGWALQTVFSITSISYADT